jgi:ElaB/YqjD/DUF883 family membrane-anchored ribosome-binding protein
MTKQAAKATAATERAAKRTWAATQKQFAKADKRVSTYIEKHPKKAALIAAGVGAAIAAALAAAMRKK